MIKVGPTRLSRRKNGQEGEDDICQFPPTHSLFFSLFFFTIFLISEWKSDHSLARKSIYWLVGLLPFLDTTSWSTLPASQIGGCRLKVGCAAAYVRFPRLTWELQQGQTGGGESSRVLCTHTCCCCFSSLTEPSGCLAQCQRFTRSAMPVGIIKITIITIIIIIATVIIIIRIFLSYGQNIIFDVWKRGPSCPPSCPN